MTQLDLDDLARLNDRATPGPWFVRHLDDVHCMSAVAISIAPDRSADEAFNDGSWIGEEMVAATLIQQPRYVSPADSLWDENAELIARSRNALPELLRLARIGQEIERRES